jgi:hypothetical protein
MKESLDQAKEELKRVDHLIYVSLKYTRTVDVLLSVIERMINAYEFGIDSLLKKAIEDKKIKEMPERVVLKAEIVKKTYDDPIILENIGIYLLFRKLKNVEYQKSEEYRRHVTMTSEVDGREVKIDIDSINEYYKKIQSFIKYIEELINGE